MLQENFPPLHVGDPVHASLQYCRMRWIFGLLFRAGVEAGVAGFSNWVRFVRGGGRRGGGLGRSRGDLFQNGNWVRFVRSWFRGRRLVGCVGYGEREDLGESRRGGLGGSWRLVAWLDALDLGQGAREGALKGVADAGNAGVAEAGLRVEREVRAEALGGREAGFEAGEGFGHFDLSGGFGDDVATGAPSEADGGLDVEEVAGVGGPVVVEEGVEQLAVLGRVLVGKEDPGGKNPNLSAFMLEARRPSGVVGPVERWALRRLAAICCSEAIGLLSSVSR